MLRLCAVALFALLLSLSPSDAAERGRLGYGRLITNDLLGDGHDRGRSGSFSSSRIWGPVWNGTLPDRFGHIIELRLGGQVMAPDDLNTPTRGDRPYAGVLSAGLHTHFQRAGLEMAMGANLVFTGPSTQLGRLQDAFHDLLGTNGHSDATRASQIGNGVHPTVVLEAGMPLGLFDSATLRPFVEGRAGDETLVRAGFDLTFGPVGQGELMVRDVSTGQRYRAIQDSDNTGFTFVMGADIAHVSDSIYLPEDRGYSLTDTRDRVRAGLHWQGDDSSGFYGLTWMGREFEGQPAEQVIGSVRINLRF